MTTVPPPPPLLAVMETPRLNRRRCVRISYLLHDPHHLR